MTALSSLSTLAAVMLVIASAMTPLGLQEVQVLAAFQDAHFSYARDIAPIGIATQSRDDYTFNRVCGLWTSCPGNHDPFWAVQNGSDPYLHTGPQFHNGTPEGTISTAIAPNITEVFSSGTGNFKSTVAGAFDIQYRFFANFNNDTSLVSPFIAWRDGGDPRTQGQFRFVKDFIAEPGVQAVEGLIVSTTDEPGIGFRNHTLPPSSEIGFKWTEDILWLAPETSCTNLNVSFDYVMPIPGFDQHIEAWLVDRGGFESLPHVSGPSWFSMHDLDPNTQDNPNLLARSRNAAIATNFIVMGALNQTYEDWTKSHYGKAYNIATYLEQQTSDILDPRQISLSSFGWAIFRDREDKKPLWQPELPGVLWNLHFTPENANYEGDMLNIGKSLDCDLDYKPLSFHQTTYFPNGTTSLGSTVQV